MNKYIQSEMQPFIIESIQNAVAVDPHMDQIIAQLKIHFNDYNFENVSAKVTTFSEYCKIGKIAESFPKVVYCIERQNCNEDVFKLLTMFGMSNIKTSHVFINKDNHHAYLKGELGEGKFQTKFQKFLEMESGDIECPICNEKVLITDNCRKCGEGICLSCSKKIKEKQILCPFCRQNPERSYLHIVSC